MNGLRSTAFKCAFEVSRFVQLWSVKSIFCLFHLCNCKKKLRTTVFSIWTIVGTSVSFCLASAKNFHFGASLYKISSIFNRRKKLILKSFNYRLLLANSPDVLLPVLNIT